MFTNFKRKNFNFASTVTHKKINKTSSICFRLNSFCLQILQAPLLLTAAKKDKAIRPNIEQEYQAIVGEVVHGQFKLFDKPGHPAIESCCEEVAETINQFIYEYS